MSKMSISTRIYLGFALMLALIGLLGWKSMSALTGMKGALDEVKEKQFAKATHLAEMESEVHLWVRMVLNAVLATNAEDAKAAREAALRYSKDFEEHAAEYERLVQTAQGKKLVQDLDRQFEEALPVAEGVFALVQDKKQGEARDLWMSKGKPASFKVQETLAALLESNRETFEKVNIDNDARYRSARLFLVAFILAALLLGAGFGTFLSRSINKALNKVIHSLSSGSEQVSSASGQISKASQSLAEGASQQASSLEETSASLEEMASMTRQNSDNARQASAMANDARGSVEKSREAMSRMSEAIVKIKSSSDQTARIIKTIDEIAFQTNLLALNAAVEAARAGDAGKGFAVVAEEVRNLAQRSAEAAKTTSSLIEESRVNADHGVTVSQEVGEILSRIVEAVHKLVQLIGEVSSASEEQAKGIDQINTAVTQMDKLTQQNASSAEESASASEELSAQSQELAEMVRILMQVVRGDTAGGAPGLASHPGFVSHPVSAASRSEAHARTAAHPAEGAARARSGRDTREWRPREGRDQRARSAAAFSETAPASAGKTVRPEEVIPLNDDELKDF